MNNVIIKFASHDQIVGLASLLIVSGSERTYTFRTFLTELSTQASLVRDTTQNNLHS